MTVIRRIGVTMLTVVILAGFPATAAAARPPARNVLKVITVPPLPSAKFALDGKPLVTDAHGTAYATVRRSRDKHRLQLLTPHLDTPGGSADFVRWAGRGDVGQGFAVSQLDLVIGRATRIQATFQTSRTVRYGFVDQARRPVAPERITSMTLRGDSGQQLTVEGVRPVTLTAVRPVAEAGSAVGKEVTYYVQSVVIDGANVVNTGEQRLLPNRTADAEFVVLLRSARFRIRDWLSGDPLAGGLDLTYPDGRTERLTAGQDGDVAVENLARGTYQVKVAGAGYSQAQKILLSRSRYVDLPVVTYADMVALAVAALTTLLVLVVAGRRRLGKRPRTAT
ncbi:hypothetical protein [Amycolatopsis decaplanina]|uniref:Prealbumin-like fold domain-containing protein n=1 Tax=Amycolatopsis decaplanina DSM 44594 TaxID=1284240 RepID=M2XKY7_9PSEU|nr:hypothetical protein [Amycolatopsis decaplanina]EME61681.1 hypothetical protein H074_10930 [Amycolatopsis decaplanina DSM 44594]